MEGQIKSNAMGKRTRVKGQTMIYKTRYRKRRIGQYEPHKNESEPGHTIDVQLMRRAS